METFDQRYSAKSIYDVLIDRAEASRVRFGVNRIQGEAWAPNAIIISPDNKWLVTGRSDGVACRDIETGGLVRSLSCPIPSGRKRCFVHSIALSSDGRTIVMGDSDGNLNMWDVVTGNLCWHKDGGRGGHRRDASVGISTDGTIIASGGSDGHIRIWEGISGELLADIILAEQVKLDRRMIVPESAIHIVSLAISPDGRWIACGIDAPAEISDAIVVIDTRSWKTSTIIDPTRRMMPIPFKPRESMVVHGAPFQIGFSPDGRKLLAACCDGATLFEVPGWRDLGVIGYDWKVDELAWRQQEYIPPMIHGARFLGNTLIATLHHYGLVLVADSGARKRQDSIVFATMARSTVHRIGWYDQALATSPNGRWIAVGANDEVVVLNVDMLGNRL